MEWVETTGKSVAEAVDSALDQLGVDEADAEYEVVSEPKTGMFGRVKAEARIRARVRPTAPPSKDAANNNRRRRNNRDRPPRSGGSSSAPAAENTDQRGSDSPTQSDHNTAPNKARSRNRRKPAAERQGVTEVADQEVALDQQGEVAVQFLQGFLAESQVSGNVTASVQEDDEIIQIAVGGDNLGHLIGPKGSTLQSLQELTRTVVQRQTGARNGRIVVDVGAYREKRREALERFSKQIADDVIANGGVRQLEAMNPADRKVVHDTINEIAGVNTTSEGEEPRRYVVVRSDND